MQKNNISRFLYESAVYLDLNPARAFRKLCAGVDSGNSGSDGEAAGESWLQSLCERQTEFNSLQNCNT